MSVSMASTIGSDIIVVAKDVTGTQVMSRKITFCGNGVLDLKEECDGSLGCIDQCKCQFGTVAVNGTCVDRKCQKVSFFEKSTDLNDRMQQRNRDWI